MAIANLGSIANRIQNQLDNIPTSISGTEMYAMIYDKVIFMEAYTGLSIGSTAIAERFQPALLGLSKGAVQSLIETQGADVKSFHLGDLDVTKNSPADSMSNIFTQQGMEELKRIGRKFQVYKAYG